MQSTCPKACGFCEHKPKSTPAWARGLALARGEIPLPMKPPTGMTAAEQITLSYSVGGPARPDNEAGEGAERPTNRSAHAASRAPASWRATGPYPDPNHAPASHESASHVASHVRQAETGRQRNVRLVASHAPASHAPASHADSHVASRADRHAPASPAPPPMLVWAANTEQLWLAWAGMLVFCAGLVVGRHIKGGTTQWAKMTHLLWTKRKLIADPDGKRDLSV